MVLVAFLLVANKKRAPLVQVTLSLVWGTDWLKDEMPWGAASFDVGLGLHGDGSFR
jgi:hypothetical protein